MFSFLSQLIPLRGRSPRAQREKQQPLSAQWLVVGLGNPGPTYESTRHNVGYMALDELSTSPFKPVPGMKAEVSVHGDVAFARSTTYMNSSGEAVAPLARALGVNSGNIIVLHDELDLPPGRVRLRRGGSENGHNGLKSISEHLGTRDYLRVRIGIGRPPKDISVLAWVLGPVEGDIGQQISLAAEAARMITVRGLEKAQNEIHSKS
ncbi:aminoacyl-tRNA hydrolase [Corynebacterium mayonis]|uniref:aminoacyl-tRNA hydrolase n=1 Tax=Corynebacterium mayonis TaxID=3062461 RepID=UPI003CC80D04